MTSKSSSRATKMFRIKCYATERQFKFDGPSEEYDVSRFADLTPAEAMETSWLFKLRAGKKLYAIECYPHGGGERAQRIITERERIVNFPYQRGVDLVNALMRAEFGAKQFVLYKGDGYYYWSGNDLDAQQLVSEYIDRIDTTDRYQDGTSIPISIADTAIAAIRSIKANRENR